MAKPRGVDATLNRLWALRREPAAESHVAELRQALGHASSLVVETAANIAGDRGLAELGEDSAAAFERFMIEPTETDPRCRAKNAIAEALNKIDYQREGVFLRGVRHFQEKPPPPPPEVDDPAALLRAQSALGLARLLYPGVVLLLAELFFDKA